MINNKISLFIFYSLMSLIALIAVWKCFSNYICIKVNWRSSPCENGSCSGFVNRHKHPLPKKKCLMEILVNNWEEGERAFLCYWKPFNKSDYSKTNMPSEGYLGSAKVIHGHYYGFEFHAWEQNDSEFVWYSVSDSCEVK
jgi:hypothetical protein